MKILFLGSSHFSVVVLKRLLEEKVEVDYVITSLDKPSGRGHKLVPNEVKVFAQQNGIEVFSFDRVRKHMEEIKLIDYDLAIVASFGQILPNEFLEHRLTINVHPSLLPKYRGASPIQSAILNGDKKTGVTIMKLAEEVDSGDIISQKEIDLDGEYYLELEEKLGNLGGQMLKEVISQIENNSVKFTPQNHKNATFVQKFDKNDGILDLNDSAENFVNKIRALAQTLGCTLKIGEQELKIGKAKNVSNEFEVEKGYVSTNKKRFVVGANDGAVEILFCQAPSGKMIAGRDYLNGHNDILGKRIL